jgi:hypothetical protein
MFLSKNKIIAKVGGEERERIKKNVFVVAMADDNFWIQEV